MKLQKQKQYNKDEDAWMMLYLNYIDDNYYTAPLLKKLMQNFTLLHRRF